jgi:hypothetical protein
MNIVKSNDESTLEFIRSLGIETTRLAKVTIFIEVGKPVLIETLSYSKELKILENHTYELHEIDTKLNPTPSDSGSQV